MLRWLGLLLAIGLTTSTADAQVFKPKAKKETKAKSEKSGSSDKKATKSARSSPGKKRVTTKSKKKTKSDRASDSGPKDSDKDFVKITDDDDIE